MRGGVWVCEGWGVGCVRGVMCEGGVCEGCGV